GAKPDDPDGSGPRSRERTGRAPGLVSGSRSHQEETVRKAPLTHFKTLQEQGRCLALCISGHVFRPKASCAKASCLQTGLARAPFLSAIDQRGVAGAE